MSVHSQADNNNGRCVVNKMFTMFIILAIFFCAAEFFIHSFINQNWKIKKFLLHQNSEKSPQITVYPAGDVNIDPKFQSNSSKNKQLLSQEPLKQQKQLRVSNIHAGGLHVRSPQEQRGARMSWLSLLTVGGVLASRRTWTWAASWSGAWTRRRRSAGSPPWCWGYTGSGA